VSDNELGAFLRARRESISPAEVGLPEGPRRRVPGLRRAELATLAGISVDYLTRIEQGRDRHPSMQIITVLCEALRLSGDERVYLYRLTKAGTVCPGFAPPPAQEVRPTIRALLDRLDPGPAILLNRIGDIVAQTKGYARMTDAIGVLESPNLVRFMFTDARAKTAYPDWGRVADEHIAALRIATSFGDPYVAEFAEELTAVDEFAERWRAPATVPQRAGVERLVHPEAGELRLAYEILELPEPDDLRLIVYLPADDATVGKLNDL
jgi:transcriptional regulator with XRE-family HTH domain